MMKRYTVSSIMAMGTAIILLFAVEGALRIWRIGEPHELFHGSLDNGDVVYKVNPMFYAQYFPASFHEHFFHLPDKANVIPVQKSETTCRIFVLGGSVAQGGMPDGAFSFPRTLERMLSASFPGIQFEIINLACMALNSHVMRLAAKAATQLEPDVFVVYMGNNEYIGPYGPALYDGGIPPSPLQLSLEDFLKSLRLFRVMSSVAAIQEKSLPVDVEKFYADAHKVHPSDSGRDRMYGNFHKNLRAICNVATNMKATVVLCTLGNNIRHMPPFASLHHPDLSNLDLEQWQEYFSAGSLAQDAGDWDFARQNYELALAIDPTHAESIYRMGQALIALGQYSNAREALTLARDYDAFPVRATSRVNQLIREVARENNRKDVLLADAEAAFVAASPQGIMGYEIFYDAVHVLFEGNYIIAQTVFDSIRDQVARRTGVPADGQLSFEDCKKRLGLSPYLEAVHLRVALDELETYSTFHKQIDSLPLRQRLVDAEARCGPDALENAVLAVEQARDYWGEDYHIQRLLTTLRSRVGERNDTE